MHEFLYITDEKVFKIRSKVFKLNIKIIKIENSLYITVQKVNWKYIYSIYISLKFRINNLKFRIIKLVFKL